MMDSKHSKAQSRFDRALSLLDGCVKFLALAKADQAVLEDLIKLLANLKRLPDGERATLLQGKRSGPSSAVARAGESLKAEVTSALSLAEVEAILSGEAPARQELEQIAMLRFGMSRGALSLLPKEALIDKIRVLVEHEGTHASIARAAGGHGLKSPVKDESAATKVIESSIKEQVTNADARDLAVNRDNDAPDEKR